MTVEKEKTSRRHTFFFTIIIPFLLTFSIFFMRNKNNLKNKLSSLRNREKTIEIAEIIKYDGDLKNTFVFKDNIVRYENNKIYIDKPSGESVKETNIEFFDPFFYVGRKAIYLGDKYNGTVTGLDEKGNKTRDTKLDSSIIGIKEADGKLIHHLFKEKENIVVVDDKGNILFNEQMDTNILSYDIKATTLAVGTMDLRQEQIVNSVHIYDEENTQIDLGRETPLYIKILDKNDILVLTDENLFRYKDGDYVFNKGYDFVRDIELVDNKIHIIYNNIYEMINKDGEVEIKLELDQAYEDIDILGNDLLISNKMGFLVLNKDKILLNHKEENKKIIPRENKIFLFDGQDMKMYIVVNKI